MAIEALVVSTLDDNFDWVSTDDRQLVGFSQPVVNATSVFFDWGVVAVFFGIGAKNVARDGRHSQKMRRSNAKW
jgi:hypothetical protein